MECFSGMKALLVMLCGIKAHLEYRIATIIPTFGVIFWYLTRGGAHIGYHPTVIHLVLEKYHQGLYQMHVWGYFEISNGVNWEIFSLYQYLG